MNMGNETDDDRCRRIYEAYQAERESLAKAEYETTSHFHTWTLTCAGAALGVSFSFLNDVVGPGPYSSTWALIVGWSCLAIATCASLTCMHLGVDAYRGFREDLDEQAKHGISSSFWADVRKRQELRKFPLLITLLARGALALTLLGVFLLVFFCAKNV